MGSLKVALFVYAIFLSDTPFDAGAEASFRVFLTPSANLAIEPITMPVLE